MSTSIKKSRKRIKRQCLECGSCFGDESRKNPQSECDSEKKVKIKHFECYKDK